MIYTILNLIILLANFVILIFTVKHFSGIVEEALTPKLLKLKETVLAYIYSALDVKMHDFEVKVYRDIAKIVQDQHDANTKFSVGIRSLSDGALMEPVIDCKEKK